MHDVPKRWKTSNNNKKYTAHVCAENAFQPNGKFNAFTFFPHFFLTNDCEVRAGAGVGRAALRLWRETRFLC